MRVQIFAIASKGPAARGSNVATIPSRTGITAGKNSANLSPESGQGQPPARNCYETRTEETDWKAKDEKRKAKEEAEKLSSRAAVDRPRARALLIHILEDSLFDPRYEFRHVAGHGLPEVGPKLVEQVHARVVANGRPEIAEWP